MALNTPKRVRTLASFASSPPPSGEGSQLGSPMHHPHSQSQWNGQTGTIHSTATSFHNYPGGSSASVVVTSSSVVPVHCWMDGSLSPASSSCGSPEFLANRSHPVAGIQQFHPPPGALPGHLASAAPPGQNQLHQHQQQLLLQQHECRENSRRGRPRSEALTTLMIEGSTSPSAIKCGFCNRVFPREKSLQAHLRTHTGKRDN